MDFNYYPFPRISTGKKWNKIDIDSLEDIAVNKVHTISVKPRSRDFIAATGYADVELNLESLGK